MKTIQWLMGIPAIVLVILILVFFGSIVYILQSLPILGVLIDVALVLVIYGFFKGWGKLLGLHLLFWIVILGFLWVVSLFALPLNLLLIPVTLFLYRSRPYLKN